MLVEVVEKSFANESTTFIFLLRAHVAVLDAVIALFEGPPPLLG